MNCFYLSPGPARLPLPVREQIAAELLDTFGIGVSIMEISHRSKQYEKLNEETLALARDVFAIPPSHKFFFSCLGAQHHFSLLIDHLAAANETIAYADTGVWAHLACSAAKASGRTVKILYNGAPDYISLGNATEYENPQDAKFVHLTVNNTAYGTEYPEIPTHFKAPLALDMTSSLGARNDIPWEKTGLIYASAQKNFGIAGVSLVIMRSDLLEESKTLTKQSHVGHALTYHAIHDAHSVLNTPPVFAIFAMNKMLNWMKKQGGVLQMERLALAKAKTIYTAIDGGFYKGRAYIPHRSRHNFVFCLPTPEQDAHFIAQAEKQGILEIKGYKSIGGIRASFYNGLDLDEARIFAEFIHDYRKRFG